MLKINNVFYLTLILITFNLNNLYSESKGGCKKQLSESYHLEIVFDPRKENARIELLRVIYNKYKKELELLKKSAERGHPDSQFLLGLMYRYGTDNFQVDEKKAFGLFEKAAKQGHREAQYELGKMYRLYESRPYSSKKLAELKNTIIPKNNEEAANWFIKAAEQGHTKAQ